MSHDNARIFRNGLQKAYNIIVNHLTGQLYELCVKLLAEVPRHRQFLGFTGNTQTSYMCGVYVDGRLHGIVMQGNWLTPPLRKKIRKGKWGYLRNPYEGHARSVQGKVDVDGNYGAVTSTEFLRGYNAPRNRLCIVMTTGTEYSVYLEQVSHLDVLTGTFEAAKVILAQGFKPISA